MTIPFIPRVLRPRRAAPADAVRPTRADINLEALRHNLRVTRRQAGGARVWAVLKADAYGHGAPAVARTLERAKIDGFCVALLEEAVELREAGIVAPILVMGGHYGSAHDEVVTRGLVPVVHDLGQVESFARLVRSGDTPGPIDVHLKVDTGMARLGVTMTELPDVAAKIGIELRNQYVLGYSPANQVRDGKYRKVSVKLVQPRGLPPLHAFWRTGYYAPTQ